MGLSNYIFGNACVHVYMQEVGVDKSTHKDLRKVPDDLLPALEEHLSEMDSLRKANASQPRSVDGTAVPV